RTLRGEAHLLRGESRQRAEPPALLLEILEVRNRGRFPGRAALAIGFPHHRQSIDVRKRRGTKQDSVYYAEDRGVGTDTECQRGYGCERETGRAAQRAERDPDVVGECHTRLLLDGPLSPQSFCTAL